MKSIFPQPILDLFEINISFDGVKSYVVQGEKEQVVFMEFENNLIFSSIHMKVNGRLF